MEKKKQNIVLAVGIFIACSVSAAVLGWVVAAVADDIVLDFVMPPMVGSTDKLFGSAPLVSLLDDRYVRSPDDDNQNEGQRISIDEVREAVREELEGHVDAYHQSDGVTGGAQNAAATQEVENVRLYLSTVEGEDSLIVLNGNNPMLRNILHGDLFVVSRSGVVPDETASQSPLRAELRNLDAPGQGMYASIGRVPQQHFERLGGRVFGYVDADIRLVSALP